MADTGPIPITCNQNVIQHVEYKIYNIKIGVRNPKLAFYTIFGIVKSICQFLTRHLGF